MADELKRLFAGTRSPDEREIEEVRARFDALLSNIAFYIPLMDFLATAGMTEDEYICAAGALRMWFSRCWTSTTPDQKDEYLSRLQQLLIVPHPASKFLLELYRLCRTVSADNTQPFNNFLSVVIPLISPDSRLEVLVMALSVTWLTFKASTSNLSGIRMEMQELYGNAQMRIAEIETKLDLISSVLGCRALRYAFKVIHYSISRFCASPEIVLMHVSMTESLVMNINPARLAAERDYFLLIRYCGKLLTHFFHFLSKNKSSIEILDKLVLICCQAISILVSIPELPRSAVWSFYHIPWMHYRSLPVSQDVVKMLALSCRFSSIDVNDFMHNPGVFYATAYPNLKVSENNSRRYAALIAMSMARVSDRFIQIVLNQEPCEETSYILQALITPLLPSEFGPQIREWCLEYFKRMKSEIDQSTFLFLIAKSIDYFNENDLTEIHGFTIKCLGTTNLVVICNSLKVLRKLIRIGNAVDEAILRRIIEIASVCPTDDASRTLRLIFRTYREAVLPFAADVVQSILAGVEKEVCDCDSSEFQEVSISQSLDTITEMISNIGRDVITENLIVMSCEFLERFSDARDILTSLGYLYSAVFASEFEHSGQLFVRLIDGCESTHLERNIRSIYPAIAMFMEKYPHILMETDISEKLLRVLVYALTSFVQEIGDEAACADLISWIIQIDKRRDVAPVFAALDDVVFLETANKLQIWASAFIDGRVPFDEGMVNEIISLCNGNLPCLYEKSLYGVALLKAACEVTGDSAAQIKDIAVSLIHAAKEQRASLGECPLLFPCGHNFTFPVEKLDVLSLR